MAADDAFGVIVQKVCLFLQFVRRGPVVVAIQKCNVRAAGANYFSPPGYIVILIGLGKQQSDSLGIATLKIQDNIASMVRRAVLNIYSFEFEISVVHEDAFYGLANELLVVVG
jgi:hypothetical protein